MPQRVDAELRLGVAAAAKKSRVSRLPPPRIPLRALVVLVVPVVVLVVLGVVATQSTARAQEPSPADADSLSIGYADEGRLEHPFAIQAGPYVAPQKSQRFGTRELVGLIERAGAAVGRAFPGSVLAVGDLSAEAGGHLTPHESHQAGRDADIAFYMLEANGEMIPQALFGTVGADLAVRRGDRRLRFDVARNWALLVAFVDDPMAETQYVLVAPHIRARLLEHAAAIGASPDQVRRVELVTREMRGSESHDDHFHVRIYCSVGDRPQCLDRPPLHPWYYGTPSPEAVAAARVADLQRAAALRRQQQEARRAEQDLTRERERQAAMLRAQSAALANEPTRQERLERRRATRLTRDERMALAGLREMEASVARQARRARGAEEGRGRALDREERRWLGAERRRAARLRSEQARLAAEERRRAAEARRAALRAQRRAEAQQAADRRRAQRLIQASERLAREREREAERARRE